MNNEMHCQFVCLPCLFAVVCVAVFVLLCVFAVCLPLIVFAVVRWHALQE